VGVLDPVRAMQCPVCKSERDVLHDLSVTLRGKSAAAARACVACVRGEARRLFVDAVAAARSAAEAKGKPAPSADDWTFAIDPPLEPPAREAHGMIGPLNERRRALGLVERDLLAPLPAPEAAPAPEPAPEPPPEPAPEAPATDPALEPPRLVHEEPWHVDPDELARLFARSPGGGDPPAGGA
jgi:hypothetical protein